MMATDAIWRRLNLKVKMDRRTFGITIAGAMASCSRRNHESRTPELKPQPFGKAADGTPVEMYKLRKDNGMEIAIITYGGIVQSLRVPDAKGKITDLVLGFDDMTGYQDNKAYFGALIGRYGNRIGNARFTLNGVEYKLAANDGKNTLHGGKVGFDKRIWTVVPQQHADGDSLRLHYLSKDGEEGFPGNLDATVTYTLLEPNALRIDYVAKTDKATVVNLTNHSYFNLSGADSAKGILDHEVNIEADHITPVDSGLIPTGSLARVDGTPFDFRQPRVIGERIEADDEQIRFGKGYDHNFVLRAGGGLQPVLAATVRDPKSGRRMEVLTTEPGLQFYTGNFLDGSLKGKGGKAYPRRFAFCMETQHFPDSPNQPTFPSTVLRPEHDYKSTTIYRFPNV